MGDTEQLVRLRRRLTEHFSSVDVTELYFKLGIDSSNVTADTHSQCVDNLLSRLDRSGLEQVEAWLARRDDQNGQININTGGGSAVHGSVTVERGNFIGRDQINITEASTYDIAGLPNPFLGLRAFTFDDRDAFAGRDAKAAETVEAMTDFGAPKTLLFITGASGSGKSSFAQAGLLPRLHSFYAQRHRAVQHAVFRPSRDPMAGLSDAFAQLGTDSNDLTNPTGHVNLIVIDQFEECFTQSDPAMREALFKWLIALPAFDAANTHVIATLRSDYLNELFEEPALWGTARRDSVELRAMGEAELREAIQQPLRARQIEDARYMGKHFEPALVDRLTQDAAASAAYLTLLQVTLEDLWDKGKLILSNYGNLTDAIRQRAEQVFAFADFDRADPQIKHTPEAQAALLGIFLDLIEVSADDDPRRDVRRRRDKAQLTKGDPARTAWVDELTRARLLSVSADSGVELVDIIHESLIANWDRLREAVATGRRQLRQRGRFEQQLRWWQSNAQAEGDLLSGVALAEAHELDAAGDVALHAPQAQDYLKRSVAIERAEQQRELDAARKLAEAETKRTQEQLRANARLRMRNIVLTIVLVMALGLAIVALLNANEAKHKAQVAQARQLSAQAAADAIRSPARASLLGVEAYRTVPALEMLVGLLNTLQTNIRSLSALPAHESSVWSVAFSPDGKVLASASSDKTVRLWDISDPKQPKPLGEPLRGHESFVSSVVFSPDGKILASASDDTSVRLWDISDLKQPKPLGEPLRGHESSVWSVVFSPDGKTLASGSNDKNVQLWDVSNPAQPKPLGEPLRGHESEVISVAFSPDGKILASGSNDKNVQLWDVSNPAQPKLLGEPLRGHGASVRSVAFSPDGKVLASGSNDNTIRLWDVSDPAKPEPLGEPVRGHESSVWSVVFSPDGKNLASTSFDKTIRLWDVSNPKLPKSLGEPLRGHESFVWSVAFSPDGKTLASGSNDKTARLWDVSDPARPKSLGEPLRGQSVSVNSAAYSPDGKILASASDDITVQLWDVSDPAKPKPLGESLRGHESSVLSVAFSPDGKILASASDDTTVQLWDVSNPAQPKLLGEPLRGHVASVQSVAFSPDGKVLASASEDTTVQLWDVSNPAQPKLLGEPLRGHKSSVLSVAFSPDGKILASASDDTTVRLWDISNLKQPKPLSEPLPGHQTSVNSVAFSLDSKTLASASLDNAVRLWDISNPKLPKPLGEPLRGHESFVSGLAFSPDGKTLASGSWDNAVRLWDVSNPAQPKPLGEPLRGHGAAVNSVAFSPDGKILASASDDTTVQLWDVDVQRWITQACRIAGRNLSQAEWRFYLPNTPYRITCPQWLAGQ